MRLRFLPGIMPTEEHFSGREKVMVRFALSAGAYVTLVLEVSGEEEVNLGQIR